VVGISREILTVHLEAPRGAPLPRILLGELPQASGPLARENAEVCSLFEIRIGTSLRPHPEEARSAVSKDEGGPHLASILRDARLRRAPQDEGDMSEHDDVPPPFAPAKAGAQLARGSAQNLLNDGVPTPWVPAFAGTNGESSCRLDRANGAKAPKAKSRG
jgi:hypothetical protein